MSEYIPFEIQEQIIKKLPIKSLIQYRSVSKSWKSLIDSSEFIAGVGVRHTHPESLLLRYKELDFQETYFRIVDDDTFPNKKHTLTIPPIIKQQKDSVVVGSSHGLFFFHDYGDLNSESQMVVIWNPSIRKVVVVPVPESEGVSKDVFGFGVCPATSDPKIICLCDKYSLDRETFISRQAEVFSLSMGTWTNLSSNLPRKSINFRTNIVVLDRFVYGSACHRDYGDAYINMIISFDLTDGEFGEVHLPDSLDRFDSFSISKLRDSLVVSGIHNQFGKKSWDVWTMKDGDPKSFVKMFSIDVVYSYIFVLGFQITGKPIMEVQSDREEFLGVYDPYLKQVNKIHCDGRYYAAFVQPCMESLLLLNQPNLINYLDIDEDKDAKKRLALGQKV